jgi:peptide deformylase
MAKILRRTEFGNPVLRRTTNRLSKEEILSAATQQLIENMYYTLELKKYGVGLAATQVGQSLAVSVIDTKPTPTRPELKRQKLTIINPEIMKLMGKKTAMWEGCISGSKLYAKVPRHTKIRLKWQDEKARTHEQDFDGFLAHVIQHEVDHLNGTLFVDRVKDTTSYMTFNEYKKMKTRER